jgi:hypothetical protein
MLRFVEDKFKDKTEETKEAYYLEKTISVMQNKKVNLSIWVFNYNYIFRTRRGKRNIMRSLQSTTSRPMWPSSFTISPSEKLSTKWRSGSQKSRTSLKTIISSSLSSAISTTSSEKHRSRNKVSYTILTIDAEAIATEFGAKHFYSSAKSSQGVEDMFQFIAAGISFPSIQDLNAKNMRQPRKKSKLNLTDNTQLKK